MDNHKQLIEELEKLRDAFSDPCEGTVYHYTSANGLRGIIDKKEIWLTNTVFVNDPTECKYLQNQKDLFSDNDFSNEYVCKRWNVFKILSRRPIDSYYVASFSKFNNSLHQFLTYGNFCIGFDTKQLVQPGFNLFECFYDYKKIRSWILEKEKVDEWRGNFLNDQAKGVAADILWHAASVKFKNIYYKAENEIRLFSVSHHSRKHSDPLMYKNEPPIHFRDHITDRMPIPYVKFSIPDKKTIKEIRIGPMLRQDDAKIACEILLCEKGYENTQVNISDIPNQCG